MQSFKKKKTTNFNQKTHNFNQNGLLKGITQKNNEETSASGVGVQGPDSRASRQGPAKLPPSTALKYSSENK